MNAKTLEAITTHGNNLLSIFPNATERNPVALCKKLRRLETVTSRWAVAHCNGDIDGAEWGKKAYYAKKRLQAILGNAKGYDFSVYFVNGDPRGYALKIGDEHVRKNQWTIDRDWGGYGLIAPDLTQERN